jgi:serine/threonine protein kinase/tetratricopeptide (TPR) repeat protein
MDREVAVFSAARRLPAGERAAYLDEACAGDEALRQRVEELLQAGEEASNFLQNPAPGATVLSSSITEKAGDKIGRYKLLQQIGEGGCGVVYMAEQEEPVRRRVAVKVIKLGMDTKNVIARFEAERQALALMDHPNIAKVLDAGATETGRPYFVMELVKGVRITEYCDQNNLPTTERLALFTSVCHAIQHAHQKGIIHRDIKPSNILVTMHDGVPVPKVIDFGIAKATDQRLTNKTLFTAFEQLIGTPAYMSPEQAEMSGLDIDTRSDIYALGVLLYELLTGKTPFDAKELLASGLDAMRRTIREQEPARPSTRLSTMLAADLSAVAKHRQCEVSKLTSSIRGDLDWMVMKCLEKDRTRRYETASALVSDIQRHLNNEPVVARPPSRYYRLQKAVRRNKGAFAAAAAITIVLVAGAVVSTWQAIRATQSQREQIRLRAAAQQAHADEAKLRQQAELALTSAEQARDQTLQEKRRAETEATKSQQVARFLKDMLQGVGPSKALGRDTAMLREILDSTAKRAGKDLTNQPSVEAELRMTIGEAYYAIAEDEKAKAMLEQAVAIRKKLSGSEQADLVTPMNKLAKVLWRQNQFTEAETMARQALAMARKLPGSEYLAVAESLGVLGTVLNSKSDLAGAEAALSEALSVLKKLLGNEDLLVSEGLGGLSAVLQRRGKLAEAEAMAREALAMRKRLLGNEHPAVAGALNGLANVLFQQGNVAEAETKFREALIVRRKLLGKEHPDLAQSLNNLGKVLNFQGKLDDAEALCREALTMRRNLFGADHVDVRTSLSTLEAILRRQGKSDEIEILLQNELALGRSQSTNDSAGETANLGWALQRLADVRRERKELSEARSLAEEAIALYRRHPDWAWRERQSALEGLRDVLMDLGDLSALEEVLGEELRMLRTRLVPNHRELAAPVGWLAMTLLRENKFAEAEPLARECLTIRESDAPDDWHAN